MRLEKLVRELVLTSSPSATRPAWAAGHPCAPFSPCSCILPARSSSLPPGTNAQPLSSPHTPAAMGPGSHSSEPSACFPQDPRPVGQRLLSIAVLLGSGSITDHKTFFSYFFFPFLFCEAKKYSSNCQEGLRQICHGPFLWLPVPAASPSLASWPLACPLPNPSLLLASPFLSPAGGRATRSPHYAGCFRGCLSPLCSSQLVLSAPRGWLSYGTRQRGGAEASGPRTIPRSSIKDNGYNGKSMENM